MFFTSSLYRGGRNERHGKSKDAEWKKENFFSYLFYFWNFVWDVRVVVCNIFNLGGSVVWYQTWFLP